MTRFTIERLAYRPLRHAQRLAPLITAIGVSIILQHLALLVWSRNPIAFPPVFKTESYSLAGASITLTGKVKDNVESTTLTRTTSITVSLSGFTDAVDAVLPAMEISEDPGFAGASWSAYTSWR